jgi:hypothetical protein
MLVLLMGGFMNYAAEMRSDAIMYIPSFIKISSDTQNVIQGDTHRHMDGWTHTHTHRQRKGNLISLLFVFSK